MIARSQTLTDAQRRELVNLYSWLPFGPAERIELAAEVLGLREDVLRGIIAADAFLKADLRAGAIAAAQRVYQALEECAASDPEAAEFRDIVRPIFAPGRSS